MDSFDDLVRFDRQFHLHPFTNHEELHALGTEILVEGKGVFLRDSHGRTLLDGLAGLWCVNVGYGCTEIVDAVADQMRRLPYYPSFFNSTTEPAIQLAKKLAALAPGPLNHTLFCNSGSEANETALKVIRVLMKQRGTPGKTKILSRQFAYHGVTLGTTSMTGLPGCYTPFDLPLPGFIHVPAPHAYAANREADPAGYARWCLEETARIIALEGPDTIAAIFVEPIQGAGGVIVPPDGYLKALRALAAEHNILFVADEVITGFGRIGDWFASHLWDLAPDMMTLAKGLTSGYLPLGATMVTDALADELVHAGYLAHGFTYSGHPASCAAALANLAVIERDHLVESVRDDLGPYFQEKLASFRTHPAIGEARGFGLIGALELLPRDGKSALDPATPLGLRGAKLAREEGVIVRGIRDLIAVAPPLIITRAEIDLLFAGISRALDRLWV
ncbi:MAG: putative aminotransferase [Chthoniobacteraceae bacterium]|nr:putative aminotransferase [Chthoniobacteraceae bacterium]